MTDLLNKNFSKNRLFLASRFVESVVLLARVRRAVYIELFKTGSLYNSIPGIRLVTELAVMEYEPLYSTMPEK